MKCDCLAASIPEGSRLRKWSWISHFFCGFISMKQFLLSYPQIIHWTGPRPPVKSWVRSQVERWGVSTNANHYVFVDQPGKCSLVYDLKFSEFFSTGLVRGFRFFAVSGLTRSEIFRRFWSSSSFQIFRWSRPGSRISFGPQIPFYQVYISWYQSDTIQNKTMVTVYQDDPGSLRIFRYMYKQYDSDLN